MAKGIGSIFVPDQNDETSSKKIDRKVLFEYQLRELFQN